MIDPETLRIWSQTLARRVTELEAQIAALKERIDRLERAEK